jgi:hypothetical protein
MLSLSQKLFLDRRAVISYGGIVELVALEGRSDAFKVQIEYHQYAGLCATLRTPCEHRINPKVVRYLRLDAHEYVGVFVNRCT